MAPLSGAHEAALAEVYRLLQEIAARPRPADQEPSLPSDGPRQQPQAGAAGHSGVR